MNADGSNGTVATGWVVGCPNWTPFKSHGGVRLRDTQEPLKNVARNTTYRVV